MEISLCNAIFFLFMMHYINTECIKKKKKNNDALHKHISRAATIHYTQALTLIHITINSDTIQASSLFQNFNNNMA